MKIAPLSLTKKVVEEALFSNAIECPRFCMRQEEVLVRIFLQGSNTSISDSDRLKKPSTANSCNAELKIIRKIHPIL